MLQPSTPWHYFAVDGDVDGEDAEAAALAALRVRLGYDPEAEDPDPTDEQLAAALARAVRWWERATDRVFVVLQGTLDMPGTGDARLFLPLPIVAEGQGEVGTGITEILIDDDDTPVDLEAVAANEGVQPGPRDPRDNPFIEWIPWSSSRTSSAPEAPAFGTWPYGVQNIHVEGTFGYVEADGTTPELVLQAIAAITANEIASSGTGAGSSSCDGDLRLGALTSETVSGRTHTWDTSITAGHGLTGDRFIDSAVATYRRPIEAKIGRPPRRARRRRSSTWGLV